jgi:hypothetical protein
VGFRIIILILKASVGIDGRIILKWSSRSGMGMYGQDLFG